MTLARQPITQGAHRLEPATLAARLAELPGWTLTPDGDAIRRIWRLRDFRQAAALANVVAWQAEAANHHPDIAFGWGHASVAFTTHSAKGVTLNDLIMAARLNLALPD